MNTYVTGTAIRQLREKGNAQTRLQLGGRGLLCYCCNRHGLFRKRI